MKTLALLLLGASTVHAADDPLPLIQVSASATALRLNDSAGKLVVGREELLRFGDSNLAAALQRLPGLNMNGSELRMRGLGAGYAQVLVNGEPAPPGFAIDTLSPEQVERIEILRSPGADSSAQAIAGSVNIVLRKLPSRPQRDLKASIERKQGFNNPQATLQWGGREDALAYGLSGTLARSAAVEAQRIEESAPAARRVFDGAFPQHSERASLAPRLGWTPYPGATLSWTALLDASRFDSHGSEHETTLAGPPSRSPEALVDYAARTQSLRTDLAWSQPVGDAGKLNAKAGFTSNRRNSDYLFRGYDRAMAPQLHRSVSATASDRAANSSGKYTAAAGARHSLAVGWDASLTHRGESRLQQDGAPNPFTLDQDYAASVRRVAFFAQDEVDVSPQLQAYFGLRWEGLRTSVRGRDVATIGQRSAVWSPVLQALWKLAGKRQLRAALSRTYKAPQPRDLVPRRYTVNNDNNATNPDVEGNPLLKPELAWGLDLGYEAALPGDGLLTFSTYMRRISDVTVTRLFQDRGAWVSTQANAGRALARGLELDLRLPMGGGLEWRLNAGRHWSQVDALPGPWNRLAGQAPYSANLGLDWRAGSTWRAGLNAGLQGGGRARQTALLLNESSSARTLDLYTAWQFSPKGQLRLSISNALARQRHSASLYGADSRRSSTSPTQRGLRAQLELPF